MELRERNLGQCYGIWFAYVGHVHNWNAMRCFWDLWMLMVSSHVGALSHRSAVLWGATRRGLGAALVSVLLWALAFDIFFGGAFFDVEWRAFAFVPGGWFAYQC